MNKLKTPELGEVSHGITRTHIFWNNIPNATYYKVEKSPNEAFDTPTVYGVIGTEFQDFNLDRAETYYYRVKATNATWADSDWSNVISITTRDSEVIGTILNDNFDRLSLGSDYIVNLPNATQAIVNNKLSITKGNSSNPNDNYIYWNKLGAWGLNNKSIKGIYQHNSSFPGATNGAGIGWVAANAYSKTSVFATINTNTSAGGGADFGKIFIFRWDGTTQTNVKSLTAFPSLDPSDRIELYIEESNLVVTAYAYNLTKDPSKLSPIQAIFEFDYHNSTNGNTNYYPAMYFRGGNIIFEDFIISSLDYKYTKLVLVEDGIGQGQRASDYIHGQPNQLHLALGGTTEEHGLLTCSAIRPSTTDVVLSGVELLKKLEPEWYFIRLGSNDIESARGGSQATGASLALADLQTLVSELLTVAEKGVIISTPTAHNAIDLTAFSNNIITMFEHYDGVVVIDSFRNTINSPSIPYLKGSFESPGSAGKLNDLAQEWAPGEDENYSNTNYIVLNLPQVFT